MAGQAYAVATGKAPAKRNAEVMAVEQVMRWRSEVSRFSPDRLAEFDELIAEALNTRSRCRRPHSRAGGRRRRRPRPVATEAATLEDDLASDMGRE